MKIKSIIPIIGACVVFAGCSSNMVEDTQITTNYGKTIKATVELYQRAVNTVEKYVDLESADSRALKNCTNYFDYIGTKLPSDLSTLTRVSDNNSRSTTDEVVTLQEELNELADEYVNILAENLPDLSPIEKLEDVFVQDNMVYLGGGITIPLNTPTGIAMAEYLISLAETGDGKSALEDFKNDIKVINESNNDAISRSVYLTNPILGVGQKWDNGIIYYRWGNIYDSHKSEMLTAMNTWNSETCGAVSFEELEDNAWNNWCLVVGTKHIVTIQTGDLSGNVIGLTSQVGMPYFGTLTIKDTIPDYSLSRTCLHELGHVLGLLHEHQRADRDNYVVCDTNIELKTLFDDISRCWADLKFPEYLGGLVWKTTTVHVLWWDVTVPYLAWDDRAVQVTTLSDDFDFESIMLYGGYEVVSGSSKIDYSKVRWSNIQKKYYTLSNTSLSKNDIQTIKNIYK